MHLQAGYLVLTFFGENSDDRSILVDVFNGIFNLEQSAIRVESGRSLIVLARLSHTSTSQSFLC